jgi:hypothetical protein
MPTGNITPGHPLVLTGFLAAGAHTFSLDYTQSMSRHAPFATPGAGSLSVSLTPAISLPASIWLGLAIGGALVARKLRGKTAS